MPSTSGGQWVDPNYATQSGTAFPVGLANDTMVLKRVGNNFNPYAQATPNMTIGVDAGHIFNGATLTEVAAQVTPTFTAPVSNPRIDRVVIDQASGTLSVVAGTENVSPTPPAIPAGKVPVAQVLLQTASTSISNTMITDERDMGLLGLASGATTMVGTAAMQNVGTSAGDVLQLNGSAQIPAVDGSLVIGAPSAIEFVIDGGGAAITTGVKGYLEVPFNATIKQVTLLGDQSGSVTIDIWKTTYANFDGGTTHPVAADSITASARPAIVSTTKYQDATLTGWTTSLTKGDILAFDVNVAATNITRCTVSLQTVRA